MEDVPSTGSLEALRHRNRQRVVGALARTGLASRADLARSTGLSRTTVSSLVGELLETGLVVEREDVPGTSPTPGGGRPPVLLGLDRSAGAAVGLDLGHGHIRVAVADLSHTVIVDEELDARRRRARPRRARPHLRPRRGLDRAVGLQPRRDHRPRHRARRARCGWAPGRSARRRSCPAGRTCRSPRRSRTGSASTCSPTTTPTSARSPSCPSAPAAGRAVRRLHPRVLGHRRRAHRRRPALPRRRRHRRRARPRHRRRARPGLPLRQPRLPGDRRRRGRDPRPAAAHPRPGHHDARGPRAAPPRATPACRRVIADAGHHIGVATANLVNIFNPGMVVVGGTLAGAGDLLLGPMRDAVDRYAISSAATRRAHRRRSARRARRGARRACIGLRGGGGCASHPRRGPRCGMTDGPISPQTNNGADVRLRRSSMHREDAPRRGLRGRRRAESRRRRLRR